MADLEPTVVWTGSRSEFERRLEHDLDQRPRLWEELRSVGDSLQKIINSHLFVASGLWLLDRQQESVEEERIGRWYRRWWYRLHQLPEGETVELPLIGSNRTQLVAADQGPVHSQWWNRDLVGALHIRDRVTVDDLVLWPELEAQGFALHRARAWRDIAMGDFETACGHMGSMRDVLMADENAVLGNRLLAQYVNEWSFVEAIHEQSQSKFSKAIVDAHANHVARFSGSTAGTGVKRDVDATTLVDIGRSTGLKYEPRSPYIIDMGPLLETAEPIAPEYEQRWRNR